MPTRSSSTRRSLGLSPTRTSAQSGPATTRRREARTMTIAARRRRDFRLQRRQDARLRQRHAEWQAGPFAPTGDGEDFFIVNQLQSMNYVQTVGCRREQRHADDRRAVGQRYGRDQYGRLERRRPQLRDQCAGHRRAGRWRGFALRLGTRRGALGRRQRPAGRRHFPAAPHELASRTRLRVRRSTLTTRRSSPCCTTIWRMPSRRTWATTRRCETSSSSA